MPPKGKKAKKPKLRPHEAALLASGELRDVTHANSTALWLYAESTIIADEQVNITTLVYRHMGDEELQYLLANNQLPDTQPYQTIVEGPVGRTYCESYLRGLRKPSGNIVTTVVEFHAPKSLIDTLFSMQKKIEDGCFSHGLGDKGGKGLPLFNASLAAEDISYRIVLVKRT